MKKIKGPENIRGYLNIWGGFFLKQLYNVGLISHKKAILASLKFKSCMYVSQNDLPIPQYVSICFISHHYIIMRKGESGFCWMLAYTCDPTAPAQLFSFSPCALCGDRPAPCPLASESFTETHTYAAVHIKSSGSTPTEKHTLPCVRRHPSTRCLEPRVTPPMETVTPAPQGPALPSANACDCSYPEGDGSPPQYSAWKIPWTEEPGGLPSMGSRRVGHD